MATERKRPRENNAGNETTQRKKPFTRQPLLSIGRPELFALLAPGKNDDIDVTKLTLGSNWHVWWSCNVNSTHLTQRSVIKMVNGKQSCVHCDIDNFSLKKLFPLLFAELHPSKNIGIDLETLTTGQHCVVWWVCPSGHEYKAKINNRTINSAKCLECFRVSRNIYHEEQQIDRGPVVNNIAIGDQTEEYVEQLLANHPDVECVEKIGEWAGYVDLVVKLRTDDKRRSLQVKTFTRNSSTDDRELGTKLKGEYPPDLLVAMVSKDRSKFACEFAGKLPRKFTLLWDSNKSIHASKRIFTEDAFVSSILKQLPTATAFISIEETMCPKVRLEFDMFMRLQAACEARGISCLKNKTNSDCVDAFLNGKPAQLKYVTHKAVERDSHFIVKASLSKSSGFKDGKRIKRPLHDSDAFEFVIVEASSAQEPRHFELGEFFIFPKSYLIEKGVVASTNSAGKQSLRIACNAYKKDHYGKGFHNRFDLLQ